MHQKVWFPKRFSQIDRNLTYRKISKSDSRLSFFFFPPLAVLHVSHIISPRTHTETPRCPLTPMDALYMVRKSFILFYMANYHQVILFLVCIKVSHRRTCKFYYLYRTYLVNSTRPCH